MSWISGILGDGLKGTLEGIGGIIGRFKGKPFGEAEEALMLVEMEKVLQQRDSEVEQTIRAELGAKERILVAELQQGDSYTKRARPTVVYFGLFATAVNYMAVPLIQLFNGVEIEPFTLPTEFWVAWGGITATWVVGRSAEKRGGRDRATELITGVSRQRPSLLGS